MKTYRITEKAPTVDVGNTQQQTSVTNEFVRNTPVRGRTYDAVLTIAPGAATDAVGFSFNGATGTENNFLIDGVNTTDPAFGILGTQLTLEFIGETEIITGGYNAEYGRATGGVVNVITKSGSNDFHGDLWLYATPFQLDADIVARSGEAIASKRETKYQLRRRLRPRRPDRQGQDLVLRRLPAHVHDDPDRSLPPHPHGEQSADRAWRGHAYQGDLDPSVELPEGSRQDLLQHGEPPGRRATAPAPR